MSRTTAAAPTRKPAARRPAARVPILSVSRDDVTRIALYDDNAVSITVDGRLVATGHYTSGTPARDGRCTSYTPRITLESGHVEARTLDSAAGDVLFFLMRSGRL